MTAYIMFVTAFVLILLGISAYLPLNIIEGLTDENINTLTENVELPPEPTLVNYIIFPFAFIYSTISKILLLLTVSSPHQFIAVVITIFMIGVLWKVIKVIRG